MQAENAVDQMDWIEKMTRVIASLLSVQLVEMVHSIFLLKMHPSVPMLFVINIIRK